MSKTDKIKSHHVQNLKILDLNFLKKVKTNKQTKKKEKKKFSLLRKECSLEKQGFKKKDNTSNYIYLEHND